jgi:DNA-binding NtrC family response regulator
MTRPSTERTVDRETTSPQPADGGVSVVLLSVLYHRDLGRVGERAALHELRGGQDALLSRDHPRFGPPSGGERRPLGDVHLSRTPVRLVPLRGGGVRLDPGESRTTLTVRGQAVHGPVEWGAEALRRGVVLRLGKEIVLLLHRVEVSDVPAAECFGLVGESPAIHRALREIRRVADLTTPVLVRGETGTGKELVAGALHQASVRSGGPFVAVNLAAVPPALAAAELFGVERGAFTGAFQERPGYFAMARGGTLFLDEIGDAPSDVQAMLLRAIETGEVQGVGAGRPQRVAVRLVAATDADLEAKVRDGRFRAPLLHRLAAHEIWLPPLRERRDDIGRLLLHFLREELGQAGALQRLATPTAHARPWLPASLVARLAESEWSGNVRQLRNVAKQIATSSKDLPRAELSPAIERMLLAAPLVVGGAADGGGAFSAGAVAEADGASGAGAGAGAALAAGAAPGSAPGVAEARADRRKPADVSDAEVVEALRANRWELAAAAAQLGISRPSLYVIIRRSGLVRTAGDLTVEEIERRYRELGGDVARVADALEVSEPALRRRLRELGIAGP